jgi:hypothetical protein
MGGRRLSGSSGATDEEPRGQTYEAAGVDIAAGEAAVERIKGKVRSTFRPEVIGDIGGFGGLFAFAARRYRHPVLVSSTDGVGTKALVAQASAASTPSASTWSPCASTTSSARAPNRSSSSTTSRWASSTPTTSSSWSRAWPRAAARPAAPSSAARWPSTPAPWSRRVRPRRLRRGRGRARPHHRRARGIRRRRAHRAAVAGPALQRLLAGPAGVASTSPAARSTTRPGTARTTVGEELLVPSVIYAPAIAALLRGSSTCGPSPTSPAAASPATSTGCSPNPSTPWSTGAPGSRRGCSPRSSSWVR